jgi:hypothetical protein
MLRWILSLRALAFFAYICFCVCVSGFALGSFAKIVRGYLAVDYDYQTEALMVAGQVIFQWLFMIKSSWSERKKVCSDCTYRFNVWVNAAHTTTRLFKYLRNI